MKSLLLLATLLLFGTQALADQKLRIVCNRTAEPNNPSTRIENVFILDQTDTDTLDGSELHHDNVMKLFKTEWIAFQIYRFPTEIIPETVTFLSRKDYAEELLNNASIPRESEEFEGLRAGRGYKVRDPQNPRFNFFQLDTSNLNRGFFETSAGDVVI